MQTLVVGDIHGCYDEFLSLLDAAGLAVDDLIISAGDFVDRGPKTPEVLSFFMENAQARAVMGNHERKHVRASRHEVQLARSQRISKIQFGDSYSAALAFMDTLPLYLDLPDALVVHGYFEPGIPVDKQHPTVLCGTRSGEGYLKKKYDQLWFELYDGEKPLVVGHENYSKTGQPFVYKDRVFGLDTDCFTGATLTGLLLPSFRFVSVPSRANHWMLVRRMYPETENRTQPRSGKPFQPGLVAWDEENEESFTLLLARVQQASAEILLELQSQPEYAELRPRQQACLFDQKVGKGSLSILLHLARQGKLDAIHARGVLKDATGLHIAINEVDQLPNIF